jgi:hypothetical protein
MSDVCWCTGRSVEHGPRWHSQAADDERTDKLIGKTIGEASAVSGGRLVQHTGQGTAPSFMDCCLARHGFETTEEIEGLQGVVTRANLCTAPSRRVS